MPTHRDTVKSFKLRKWQPPEKKEQEALAEWLTLKGILFFAIANGGKRDVVTAVNLKRSGVKAGVPDLMIPIPRRHWHGLFIEMKRRDGGITSKEQLQWIKWLRDQGYCAEVCCGFDQAVKLIEDYFSDKEREMDKA